jgi:large subunit ribosomal protein L25
MTTLKAEKRSMDVKAKKLRREGFVTGNVFGREIEKSIPVKMEKSAVERLLKKQHKGSQVLLDIDGQIYNTLIKDVVYNPIAGRVDEIEFQALVSNEKVHSVAEIRVVNHEMVQGGVIQENLSEISYKALPAALIDQITIDASALKVGDTVRVKDLEIAQNPEIELITNPEAIVVTVTAVHNTEPETETEEA